MEASQRERLQTAMIELVCEQGYARTTVQDLVKRAGVSTKSLYERFESKQGCLLATFDSVVADAARRIAAAHRGAGGPSRNGAAKRPGGVARAVEAFTEEVATHPQAARLALVEILVAGPEGVERARRVQVVAEQALGRSVAAAMGGRELGPMLLGAVVSGIWWVAHLHVLRGEPQPVRALRGELVEWMLTYRSPALASLEGAVVSPQPAARVQRRVQGTDERTRILHAAARVAAAQGYESLTTGQIAQEAGVEQEALIEQFGDAETCFLAAFDLLVAQALGSAAREAQGAPDWPGAVQRTMTALLRRVAADPVLAKVAFVQIVQAGQSGLTRRAQLLEGFAQLLTRTAPAAQRPSAVLADAVVGATWGLIQRHVRRGTARMLPALANHVAYVALAPTLGPEAAARTIAREARAQRENSQ